MFNCLVLYWTWKGKSERKYPQEEGDNEEGFKDVNDTETEQKYGCI